MNKRLEDINETNVNPRSEEIDWPKEFDSFEERFPYWHHCIHVSFEKATCPNGDKGCKNCVYEKEGERCRESAEEEMKRGYGLN